MKKILVILLIAISFMAHSRSVLVILSSASQLELQNGQTFRTGFYLNELMIPVKELLHQDYKIVFATPDGKRPFLDKGSDHKKYFTSNKEYLAAKSTLKNLRLLDDEKSPIKSLKEIRKNFSQNQFSGLFIPGGHAPMIDLAFNKDLGEILKKFHQQKTPTALVCHGPVALLSALNNPTQVAFNKETSDDWIYKDYKMTVFSNQEESIAEKSKLKGKVKFYPESTLKRAGAKLVTKKNWKSNVIVDRELITGQNPASDIDLVKEFIKLMKSQ